MYKVKKEKQKAVQNPYQYSLERNLEDAGCSDEIVQQFMEFQDKGEEEKQLLLLSDYRKSLLDQIHREEKKIDCLDYLVYRIQKKQRDGSAKETGVRRGDDTK